MYHAHATWIHPLLAVNRGSNSVTRVAIEGSASISPQEFMPSLICELCENRAVNGFTPTTREALIDHIRSEHPQDIARAIGDRHVQTAKGILLCNQCSALHLQDSPCSCPHHSQQHHLTPNDIREQIFALIRTLEEDHPMLEYPADTERVQPTHDPEIVPIPDQTGRTDGVRDIHWHANLLANYANKGTIHHTVERQFGRLADRMISALNKAATDVEAMRYYTAFYPGWEGAFTWPVG